MTAADTNRTIEAVWRIEAPKLIASLARMVRDVGLAEELAQDALVAALETWPKTGVPKTPGAWLMQTAKNRGIDRLRRLKLAARKEGEIGREIEAQLEAARPDFEAALDDDIGDELLSLIFTACHPVLSQEARVALTLRLLGGLTTDEIARAFLTPEPTIAQRIVRAKRTLSEARVPFEVPRGADRAERLASVLGVVYLIFNEGYSATSGEDWTRPALCEEALRLGRVLAGLAPEEPEVHGLVALMEIQASRLKARIGPDGEPVLLLDQDRSRWDQLLIRRGLAALEKAETLARAAGRFAGPLRIAGGAGGVSRAGADGQRNRLGAHCRALWRARGNRAVACHRTQSRGRARDADGARFGTRNRGRAAQRAGAEELSPAAERARGLSQEARAARGGARRVRAGGGDDGKRAGEKTAARPSSRLQRYGLR
jgi:RNA polymerase sigma factor (sigma-70 family)